MIIIHRCAKCKHPDIFHRGTTCCYTQCLCPDPDYAGPEVIPTWTPEWQLIEEITPPGSRTREFGVLCDCAGCANLYQRECAIT